MFDETGSHLALAGGSSLPNKWNYNYIAIISVGIKEAINEFKDIYGRLLGLSIDEERMKIEYGDLGDEE